MSMYSAALMVRRTSGDSTFMKILCKRAGVKHFTFHSIRHLTASMLAQEGVDIPTIQAILRHKNSMTTTRYIHRLGITKNVSGGCVWLRKNKPGRR